MKISNVALSVIGVLSLAGCDSESNGDNTPSSETRTVTVSTQVPQLELDQLSTNDDGVNYQKQTDSNGFTHALIVDDYVLCLTDEVETDYCQTISLTETFTLDITGEGTLTLSHNLVDNIEAETTPFYTVGGNVEVNSSLTNVVIEAKNEAWQYITIENSNDVESIHLNAHDVTEITSVKASKKVEYDYSFGYVLIDSTVDIETGKYGNEIIATGYKANQHLPFILNYNEDGGIIINPPEFVPSDPIVIEPPTPVVTDEQIVGGDYQSHDTSGATVVVGSGNKQTTDGNPIWVYPKEKFTGKHILSDYVVSFDVDAPAEQLTSDEAYMQIYLNGWNSESRFEIWSNGRVTRNTNGTVAEEYSTYAAFLVAEPVYELTNKEGKSALSYGDAVLGGVTEGIMFNTNFIIRIGDQADDLKDVKVIINDFHVSKQ
ncbi:hypothetical protein L0B53_00150 [Vibrio sp. SS-MA-C1-2]|uniref:hypothetical protein n=1 Tax=Vibrio sp. SS-MA-C1-2 TaxID=2908646 RepID=UPI001F30D9D2|nr:hypothetical protein [Vibrio sp. SS-MA-C1-2]UJF17223.1 hypothetical protein L0B53_00150 [Vibrio sp. SS-MA-C1-2]